MAVVTQSFSIREYAERMRTVDLRRCWPFVVGREEALSLPSMTVRRFKWWTDEIDFGRSEEASAAEERNLDERAAEVEISEGDGVPLPAGILTDGSPDPPVGEDLRRGGKGKQKTPKKRSIVELFAAAPLIAGAVDDLEEDSDDGDCLAGEGEGGETDVVEEVESEMHISVRKMKGRKKKKKGRKKKKKKSGIKGGLKLEIRALEKKKIRKGKSVRKHKVLQTSKPFSMNKVISNKLPVRSILKNQKKSNKIVSSAKAANLIKLYCESNKHVTFSVNDDILGNNRACSTMDFPQMQNLCKIFSDVLAATSAINHTNKGYDPANTIDKPPDANSCENGAHKTEVSSSDCKNQSTIVNSSNSSCSGTEKASFATMVDLNRAIEANDFDSFIPATSTLSSSYIYSGDPTRKGTPHEKNQNSTSDILPSSSVPIVVPASHDSFVSSSNTKSPTLEVNEGQCQPYANAGVNFYHQIEDQQSLKGPLSGTCYSIGSKKFNESLLVPDSVSTCKSKCSGEDFIGLPLNSQGEFIHFRSGEVYKKHNINLGCNGRKNHSEIAKKKVIGAASHHKNYYSTNERVRHWLNFAELDSSKRTGVQGNDPSKGNDRFLHCNSNPKNNEYRNGSDLQAKCNFDYHTQPAIQPTMRLMGKNVVVGGISSDCHTFVDRRTSKKNESFIGQTRLSTFPDKSLPQQWMQRESIPHVAVGRSKGNPFQIADSRPNFYNMRSFDPSFDYMHTHQSQWPSRSSDNHIFKGGSHMEKHVLPSQAFSNNSAQFLGNYISGEGPIGMEHHYPTIVASHPQNVRHNILMNSSHCKHNPRLFHGELSATKPPLAYPDFGKFSQPPLLQPTEKLPHWLVHAKEQKRNQISDSHYSHLVKKNISTKKNEMNGYSKFSCFKAPVDACNLGKRPAEFDDGIPNPSKRKGIETCMNLQQSSNGNGVYGSASGSCSSRFDNELRSGPIKLIGGAKHILKPCQMIDDENCRPIHSTIIFPGTSASFGAEKKFSNIYKF